MIKVNCKYCDKEFKTHKCWVKRGRGKYCSRSCGALANNFAKVGRKKLDELAERGIIVCGAKKKGIYQICKICGNSFYITQSGARRGGHHCSALCYYVSLKGRISHRKGKSGVYSEETLRKMSETHKRIGNRPPVLRGENHPNWRGGITSVDEKIRKSKEYKKWRLSVFKRDNYTCQVCGEKGNINADHIKPFALFKELRFDVNNGRTLCVECHRKTPTYGWNCLNLQKQHLKIA